MQAALAQLDDDELASTTAAMKKMTAALRSARKQRDANLRVRPIAERDDAAMAAIIREVFREYGMDKMEGVSLHDPDLDRLTGLYRDNGGRYWVLEQDGQVVGASAWRRWPAKSPAIASCRNCSSNPARAGWAWRAIWWCRR
ncbi:N-acetyltransferase family protein [Serratia ureilytica]